MRLYMVIWFTFLLLFANSSAFPQTIDEPAFDYNFALARHAVRESHILYLEELGNAIYIKADTAKPNGTRIIYFLCSSKRHTPTRTSPYLFKNCFLTGPVSNIRNKAYSTISHKSLAERSLVHPMVVQDLRNYYKLKASFDARLEEIEKQHQENYSSLTETLLNTLIERIDSLPAAIIQDRDVMDAIKQEVLTELDSQKNQVEIE